MITNRTIHFLGAKDCPYTLRGHNLVTLRRAKLRRIAMAFGLSGDGSKNEILQRLIARLKASKADKELDQDWTEDS